MTTPVTQEFAVAAVSSGFRPTTTTLADGRILVSWYDISSNRGDVRHRLLDMDGTPLSGEIITPASTAGRQGDQAVAALAGGGFVVVWEDEESADGFADVRCRVYDENGNTVSTGLVTTGENSEKRQYDPAVVGTADGGFVVTWGEDNKANNNLTLDNQNALVARAFSATGVPQGGIVRITSVNGSAIDPALAADGNGVIYVWDDNSQNGIYSTFIPTGVPASDQTFDGTPVADGAESNFRPDVAITAAGTVYVWENFVEDKVYYKIANGPELRLTLSTGAQEYVRVEALPFGGFVVVWQQFNTGTSSDIMCLVFDASGNRIGTTPTNLTAGQTGAEFEPDVTALIDGRFMVTWSSQGALGDVVGRIYDPRTERVAWVGGDRGERFVGTDIATQGDQLDGAGGNDRILGQAGNDIIAGGSGDDLLDGGAGRDTLIGGTGNDVFVTDGLDVILEIAGGGIDTVRSTGNITLSNNIENLVLIGKAGSSVTGNGSNNTLTGNGGANAMNGGGGNDRLAGGGGNDRLNGGAGNDTMAGGAGKDTLTGGTGADQFVFNTAPGTSSVDRITDYNVVADTIQLENAVFTGLRGGTLAAAAFVKNTSGNAADARDRIIYESDTGKLYFDKDGTGSAAKVHFATLDANLALTNADFFVF